MRISAGEQSVCSQPTRILQNVNYLCASFLMLGVPSNSVERLSGATINTFAMLEKDDKPGNQDDIIFCGRHANYSK